MPTEVKPSSQYTKRALRLFQDFGSCKDQATAYGKCVSRNAETINKDQCGGEFRALVGCLQKSAAARKKIQRYKRAQRILSFYRHNFGFVPPYSILLDGTFCCAAKEHKINIREQLCKYLQDDQCQIQTTSCVLAELESLGERVYVGLFIARKFDVCACAHAPPAVSGAACLLSLARLNGTSTEEKYFIGTQDRALTEQLHAVAGAPVLFINYMTVLLEKPPDFAKQTAQHNIDNKLSDKDERKTLRKLKKEILGVSGPKGGVVKKKKRQKGVNPLSCLKKKPRKKKKTKSNDPQPKSAAAASDGQASDKVTAAKKRRRRRKKEAATGKDTT